MSVVIEINPFLLFWKLLFKTVIRWKAMVTNLTIIIANVIAIIVVIVVTIVVIIAVIIVVIIVVIVIIVN